MSTYEAWIQTGGIEGDLMGFISYLTGRGYTMDAPNATAWAVKYGFPASAAAQPTTGNKATGFDTVPTGKVETPQEIMYRLSQANKTPVADTTQPDFGEYGMQASEGGLNPTAMSPSQDTSALPSSASWVPVRASWSDFGGEKPSKENWFGADVPGEHAGPDYYMEKGLQESGLVGGPFTAFMRSQGDRARMQWEIAKLMANVTGQPADLGVLAKVMRGETIYGPDDIQRIVSFAQNDPQGREMFNTQSGSKLLYYMLNSTKGPVTSAYDRFMQSRYEPSYNLYKGNAYENPTQPYSDYLKKSGYWR